MQAQEDLGKNPTVTSKYTDFNTKRENVNK